MTSEEDPNDSDGVLTKSRRLVPVVKFDEKEPYATGPVLADVVKAIGQ